MSATVLVVDDSLMARQQVSKALTDGGFQVVEAVDGVDALEKLAAEASSTSLIMLDVNMPNMDGLQFLQHLRGRPSHANVPVIMLTTEGQARLMQQAKALGAKGWIVKPFRPEMLLSAVQKLTQTL